MASGVYQIRHLASGKVYVGSSANIERRWAQHRYQLARGNHHATRLQRAWAKYGGGAFLWEVVEQTDLTSLIDREQVWMDRRGACDPQRGYNAAPTAGSRAGVKASDETRAKLRESGLAHGISDRCRVAQRAAMSHEKLSEMQSKATEARYRNGNAKPAVRWKNTPENRSAHIAKLAAAARGRPLSDEHRRNMGAARRGRPGRMWTQEQRDKLSATLRQRRAG